MSVGVRSFFFAKFMQIDRLIKNKWIALFLVLIIGAGIFFRVYNFKPWLHFEIDQSYDTLIVSRAVDSGIGNLPLLGPTAGGGRALRLGPAFYYLEYASAEIFGNTPPGHAALVLIFSILALPLFYLFTRKYFSPLLSLGLLAIMSFSLYSVLYGRFSWSPNVLPFLALLTFYALLRSASPTENKKVFWFLLFVAIGAITTQIHFNAFFILPPTAILFLIFTQTIFKWKNWLTAFAIILVVYSPLIVSEIKTGGQDTRYFFSQIKKQGGGSSNTLKRLGENINYTAGEYFLIATGVDNINFEKISAEIDFRPNALISDISSALLVLEIIVLFFNIFREEDRARKNFLILLVLWFFISFAYFFAISGKEIFPRFYLFVSPLPVLLLGLLLEKLRPDKNKILLTVFVVIIAGLSASNLLKIRDYFHQLSIASTESLATQNKDVLPNTARLTFQQEEGIVAFIVQLSKKNNYPVYLEASHEYGPALWYLLEKQEVEFSGKNNPGDYSLGNYFIAVRPSEHLDTDPNFTATGAKVFGTLKVYAVVPHDASAAKLIRDSQTATDVYLQSQQIDDIYTWNTLFATKQIDPVDYPDENSSGSYN